MEVLKIVRNAERGIGQHDHNRKVFFSFFSFFVRFFFHKKRKKVLELGFAKLPTRIL